MWSNSVNKLLSVILAAIIVLSGLLGLILGSTSVDARSISSAKAENIFFYVLSSEGKSILLKVIPLDDLEAWQHGQLSDITSGEDTGRDYDFSCIDNLPTTQYCEAKGFTIPELINYVKRVTTVSGADQITYSGSDKIRLMATDGYGIYTRSWTYDDLYGVNRYYFEGLYDQGTGWKSGWEVDPNISQSDMDLETYYSQYKDSDPYYDDKCATLATGVPTTAILATESFSGRTTAEALEASSEIGLADYISGNGGEVSGCVSSMLSDAWSLKLCVPMSEADLMFASSTASNNFSWIYNMRLDMYHYPSIVSQGTVIQPEADASLSSDNSTLTITMSCATPGASMYYSFDGAPQNPYTGPISVDVEGRDLSTNPVAFYMTAVKEGWDDAGIISVNCPDNPALAMISEEGTLGYTADTLTIKVGYFGGPYYVKHVFTLDELESMDVVHADYTFIDNMPSVVIDHVEGVRLSDIMAGAGIDLDSVQTFYFWTKDITNNYFTSFPKTELIDTPRYCYYSLPDNFDYDEGRANEYADSDGQLVDTVIALADDWNRCIAGATFGSDYENLDINTRFRLIYGQEDTSTHTASRSAKWIHSIVVELGGAPTLTIDAPSVLDLEVGSLFRTEASIEAVDQAIAENAEIEWSSSDEEVASVDSDGNITVHSEGTATITADFMGVKASIVVRGAGGVSAEGDAGGVQNWRMYEMSESAVELPVIEEENPFTLVIAIAAPCLLLGGVIYKVVKFRLDMKGGPDVFRNKSE